VAFTANGSTGSLQVDIDTSFFTVFRQMFLQGTVAKIGVYAWAVYSCIKSHADFNDGFSLPSQKDIIAQTGLSERQVQLSLKVLEAEGLLRRKKAGKRNVYRLREKLVDKNTVVTWDHLPAALKRARQELQNFLLTGNAKDAKIIHVERLTINVIQGDQIQGDQHVTNIQVELEKITDPVLREKMEALLIHRKIPA
jgi:DNA-binding transcriptional ArsR family regulator